MTTLAEMRERHSRELKVITDLGYTLDQKAPAYSDRAFLLSLLDEIEGLPDKWDIHCDPSRQACRADLQAIIKRQSE